MCNMASISHSITPEFSFLLEWPQCGSLVIEIIDQGPGMDQEEMSRLFQEGVQFNPNQLQAGQGSGLGLWISKGIINLHLGKLTAFSEGLGLGSTFIIEIPLVESKIVHCEGAEGDLEMGVLGRGGSSHLVNASSPSTGSARYAILDSTPPTQEQNLTTSAPEKELALHHDFDDIESPVIRPEINKILLVDDTATNRKIVRRILKIDGFTDVDEAKDGLECVEMVSSRPPHEPWYDLILMDYEMPRMNGPTATSRLRELGYTIPIIGVTGNILSADVAFFIESGVDSVLPKPVVMKDLYEAYGKIKPPN
jgi:CheY-like chemotaxis protein